MSKAMIRMATLAARKLTELGIPAMGDEGFLSIGKKIARHLGIGKVPTRSRSKELIIKFADGIEWKPSAEIRKAKYSGGNPASDAFLSSYEWRRVRMLVLKRDGAKCACCGATPANGVRMNVDHIKPRKLFPQLALDPSNLQVLCEVCNHGKGNWDCTDWRPSQHLSALDLDAHRRLAEIARE